MFWADQIVSEIVEGRQPPLKVNDWWTPSGLAHAGHIRTFLLHQAIYYGLRLHGQTADYSYGFDDMDPMDGLPPDLPSEFEQYMGLPLFRVPSPVADYASLANYYAAKYLQAMEDLDVHPNVPTTSQMYLAGEFNDAITIALDRAADIRHIYLDFGAERPSDWLPFQPICERCGKIGTTYAYAWDGSGVSYRCEPHLVKWASGCGYDGRVSPYNGNGKLFWKVEWPAKWFVIGTDYEGAGKDHFTKNGSRDYARRIATDIFETREPIGYPHEFFLIGGKKMSSSKGETITANEAAHILPARLMRFFVYRIPPRRQIEFNPGGDTVSRIYDDFDTALAEFHRDPESDLARTMRYAHQSAEPLPVYVMRFSKVSFLIQMPHVVIAQVAETEKGAPLTPEETDELNTRIEFARRWLDSYADPSARFTLQADAPDITLTREQRIYASEVAKQLDGADWHGETIHTILHDVKNNMNLPPKLAFSTLYKLFLNRDDGPQAGWFLAALDPEFVLARLRQAAATEGETDARPENYS